MGIISLVGLILLATVIFILFKFGSLTSQSRQVDSAQDAERFAKILVSEIKLYNEHKVQKALNENNIYGVLRNEIEEARNKFKSRVHQTEYFKIFDKVLVENLANNEREKLGSTYLDS